MCDGMQVLLMIYLTFWTHSLKVLSFISQHDFSYYITFIKRFDFLGFFYFSIISHTLIFLHLLIHIMHIFFSS